MDSVSDWGRQIEQLGGKSTAYWPNYPVYLPREVLGFEGECLKYHCFDRQSNRDLIMPTIKRRQISTFATVRQS